MEQLNYASGETFTLHPLNTFLPPFASNSSLMAENYRLHSKLGFFSLSV